VKTQSNVEFACLSGGQVNRFPVLKLEEKPNRAESGVKLVSGGGVDAMGMTVHEKATQGDELPIVIIY
jgi:hypothetical protein